MEAANCSLQVNRQLLDPKFESYKLSLDPLPCYTLQLDSAVAEVKLRDDQYTLDHMRAFGMYNYLHCDPWYQDSVYFVDQLGRVLNLHVTLDTTLGKPNEVFRLPTDVNACDTRVCASMHFPSSSWATVSDGTGRLYLIRTGSRGGSSSEKWEIMFNKELGDPFVVQHSVSFINSDLHTIELLLLWVEKDESDLKGSGFHVSLEWVSITSVNNTNPVYIWQQTVEDLTVTVPLSEGSAKEDVEATFSPSHFSLQLKGQAIALSGPLHAAIDHESSTWAIKDSGSLEVTLMKKDEGLMWPEFIVGDKQGKYVMNPDQSAAIADGLMHLTSEDLNPDPDKEQPACNAQELEECDILLEDSTSLCRFSSSSMKATHVVNLGSNQYLFSVVASPEEMPCFCLRHDVDALLWQPRAAQGDSMWEHIATFNALGYVQASKQDKKFFTCAPNYSYAALCECLRRVFIYRQPTPVATVLYNRKEGRQVGQVAKQQVISLETNEPILGFQASNERLFVLTSKNLFVVKVNSVE
ncbi:nudC domain-containing protein 1 isoform X3 [Ambystoma mexicanum]|uniref:nudC domain-containing protein 1 isoform X3 n=1 Tax=Ambystoma mexicanum TaxID=8296 RepID=UPI0037E9BA6E